ncbi:DNA helicase IV [compost metagenome]
MSISLHKENLRKIKFPLKGNEATFDDGVYREFRRLLNPPLHYANEGKDFNYSAKQLRLITSKAGDRTKICGLAGSGKTVVLAGRAVNAHKRHGERVLVLSFNITLASYIHDKISAVRSDFPWSAFDISTYHRFITSALNNAEIEVIVPDHLNYDGPDKTVARNASVELDEYLEKKYYTNLNIFDDVKIGYKYDTILIDEIQDYKPDWIKIIRANFLEEKGEMILFGDEKQNIYKRSLDAERRSKVVEGFGSWEKLTKTFRYIEQSPILPLIDAFQERYLSQAYELDEDESFQLSLTNIGIQGYQIFDNLDLARVAHQIISLAKAAEIHPNDITIVSSNDSILMELDYHIRNGEGHSERTLCSFPSKEATNHPKYSRHYRKISTNKKKAFNLNSGVIKLTSTHSFKGFESPYVVLLVNAKDSPEMVYTGLTRAKQNVLIFLDQDSPYIGFFESHLSQLQLTS